MEFESDAQRVTSIKTRQSEQSPTPRRTRWFAAVAAVLVVVMGIAVFGVLHARQSQNAGSPDTSVTFPPGAKLNLPANWDISGAAIVSADDIWAVGLIRGAGSNPSSSDAYNGHPMILHYTGGQWQLVDGRMFANSALTSIAMVSATDGWAVGYTDAHARPPNTNGQPHPETTVSLILHYHNGVWKKAAAPSINATLYDVQMGTNDEGVASGFPDISSEPPTSLPIATTVLLHYKNGVWSNDITVPEINPTTPNSPEFVLSGASGIWTYGDHGVYRYQNSSWQLVGNTPTTLMPHSGISSIAVTGPNDAWVTLLTGTASSGSKRESKVAHFDGNTWALVTLPAGAIPAGTTVDGFVPHTSWLENLGDGSAHYRLLHLENNQWRVSTSPAYIVAMKDISATTSIAVGAGQEINIYHYQNGAWS